MTILFAAFIFLASFMGCSPEKAAPPRQLGAWLVYWEGESGLSELEAYGRLFNRVSLFAYELDREGNPSPPPGLPDLIPRLLTLAEKRGFDTWVTVVNDVRQENGKVLLKDVNILTWLLRDPIRRRNHAHQLAVKVKNDGFSGLNLDYEGLGEKDREAYGVFVSELAQEFLEFNLGFNVVVEPRRGPLPIPASVSLTVMGYNLHGPHSGPGPRATPEFISSLRGRGRGDVSGSPAIALATGGFAWTPGGKVQKYSWNGAVQSLPEAEEKGRDSRSLTPFARLRDGSELWFEDPNSLEGKWRAAYQAGFRNLWLWHLGGNDETLFQWLARLKGWKA